MERTNGIGIRRWSRLCPRIRCLINLISKPSLHSGHCCSILTSKLDRTCRVKSCIFAGWQLPSDSLSCKTNTTGQIRTSKPPSKSQTMVPRYHFIIWVGIPFSMDYNVKADFLLLFQLFFRSSYPRALLNKWILMALWLRLMPSWVHMRRYASRHDNTRAGLLLSSCVSCV